MINSQKKEWNSFLKNRKLIFLVSLFLVSIFACNNETQTTDPTSTSTTSETSINGVNAEMIRRVEEACAKVNPERIDYYLNQQRADIYKAKAANSTQPVEKMQFQIDYAKELLNSGKTEDAILVLQKLFGEIGKSKIEFSAKSMLQLQRMVAIAYMRLGEQENCIANHNHQSCIVPIQKEGIHKIERGSRTAITIYETILQGSPNDMQSRWLLNLAYMTLGEYPDKVPAQWRIPASNFTSSIDFPRFQDIAGATGTGISGLSGGVCIDDFNKDGLLDIMASSWGFSDQIELRINKGDGTFEDQTNQANLTGVIGGLNLIHADYNNDSYPDVLILRGAWFKTEGGIPNSLLRNNGDGTFTDVTIEAGLLSHYPTQTATWADFNLDGWLDLAIGNEQSPGVKAPPELFISNGDGTFSNQTSSAGLILAAGFTKGLTSGDFNNDGFPDLYFSSSQSSNKLMMNSGDPEELRFIDVSEFAKVQEPEISFPCWFFDFNNDGWEDLFVSDYVSGADSPAALFANNSMGQKGVKRPYLFLNNQDNTFTEVGNKYGLKDAMVTMGSNFGDINNDGFLDFYLGTGDPSFNSIVPNRMFINQGGKSVVDVTSAGGFGHIQKGHGIGFGDFDNDGDQDIYAIMGGAYEGDVFQNALFENPLGNKNSWVTLRLEGKNANRMALGARIKITTQQANGKEAVFYSTVGTGGSFGASSIQQEIGLGKATKIKEVEIKWPHVSQTVDNISDLEINKIYEIVEESGLAKLVNANSFSLKKSGGAHQHHHH